MRGKYVISKFTRVDVEATQTVDIINFVKINDVDPLLFCDLLSRSGRGWRQSMCY
jgi:hypothetical protein